MTSKRPNLPEERQLSENDDAFDRFEFVPVHLRHDFKVHHEPLPNQQDNQQERQLVRQARQTRSAHLVADLCSQPPARIPFLYSNAIERAITARMTFARARKGLETYFLDVTTKFQTLEAQDPHTSFDSSLPTMVQIQRRIINICQECLSDCDVYLGMYEALPSPPAASSVPIVRFVACSTKSLMLHQVLECPLPTDQQFHDHDQPLPADNQVDEQQMPMSITVQALSAREAVIVDNITDLKDSEIHRFVPSETLAGPFSCFPLLSTETDQVPSVPIGVLSVDSCRKAQRLLPQSMSIDALNAFLIRMQLKDAAQELEKIKMNGARFLELTELDLRHKPLFQRLKVATRSRLLEIIRALQRGSRIHLPDTNEHSPQFFTEDDDALEFLDGIAKLSGNFLASYRQVHWIRTIAGVTRNPACTAYDVYDVLIRAITRSMEPLERVAVWKITKKKGEPASGSTDSSSPWEIDVVASTAVPNERAVPFIDGQERKIKRIALYKENEDAIRASVKSGSRDVQTSLLRGGIINIINTSPTTTTHVRLCENATYHLSWSDRSLQSVSWPQLRQLLPVRSMNSKHFQLRQLCHRLEEEEGEDRSEGATQEALKTPKVVKITNPNGLVLIIRDTSRPKLVKYVLEVDFSTHFEPSRHMYEFVQRAVSVAERALVCVRGREARQAKRRELLARNSQKFQSIGLNPSEDALRALQDIVINVFEDIAESLPGANVQIAELQADGAQLKYTFVGTGSTVLGCSLNRGQGVSFKCLDTKQPIVVGPTSELRSRLQRIGALRSQTQLLNDSFPFIFVPLFHEDGAIGVLSVDAFHAVPKGRSDEAHPESGILDFLVPLGKLLASAIYAKRRSFALRQIQFSCQEPLRSPQQLLFYACRALKDVMVGAWKVRVVEIDGVIGKTTLVYDFSESEREQSRSWVFNVVRPMAFRWKELCTDSIVAYVKQLQPNEPQTSDSVINLLAAIREEEEDHQRAVSRYNQLIAEDQAAPRRAVVETEKAKLVQRQIADNYFLLLNGTGEASSVLQSSSAVSKTEIAAAERITNDRYIAHALKLFMGTSTCLYSEILAMAQPAAKVFLTISTVPQFFASCDLVYLQRVANITSRYMTALQNRVRRSRDRTIALSRFRALCQKTLTSDVLELSKDSEQSCVNVCGGRYQHKLSPAKEVDVESLLQLQRDTIELVERTLRSPNIYFGMWEPALRVLRYTSASKSSIMAGKKLKHGHGVSFLALEKQIPVVVTSRDAESEGDDAQYFKNLRYFTNEPLGDQKWPFIVVPIGNLGVLALDNMQEYEKESNEPQPEIGVVDFLRKIGQSFVEVLAETRERSCRLRQQLRDEALVRVMTACENFKPTVSVVGTVSLYLPHFIIQQIENALNGVDVYIGVVDPLCERIRFICASTNSKMESKAVDTNGSISFRAFANQRTIVIPQLSEYVKQQAVEQQHDNCHAQKLKYFGSAKNPQGPFVCVPIPFVGVLSVDTFPGAAGGVFSPSFPEDGVVSFLERSANYLGENIRTLAANDAKKLLPTLFVGNQSTFPLLFREILVIISRNLLAVFEMQALSFKRNGDTGQWCEKEVLAAMKRTSSANEKEVLIEEEQVLVLQSLEDRFHLQQKPVTHLEEADDIGNSAVFPAVYQLPKTPEVLVVHCSPTRDVHSDEAELFPTVLVLRRVKGATWVYDEDFLLSILPSIHSLITLVNVRVEGVVARRVATRKIIELCSSLKELSSSEATYAMYATVLPNALECLAQALSRDHCDVYLGQRELTDWSKSCASQLQLRFIAASTQSFMKDVVINLESVENYSLTVVQSLENQQPVVVPLSREQMPVRSLTSKSAQRVFLAVPMETNYVLCADSLGQEAFVPGRRQLVEPDVVSFFKTSASKLQEMIISTRHRVSYDHIRSLTTRSHTDLKLFFKTILDVLRRDLVQVHSQQILTLGVDFTSAFRLEAWHHAPTRRPITTLPDHFCSLNDCDQNSIEHEIHSETLELLPMTNLPRTLDLSRSRMQPAEGIEKHGAFTCACMTTMLDSSIASGGGGAKLALCVYSHGAKTNETQGMTRTARGSVIPRDYGDSSHFFTNYQRQYFFAFAAVVAEVYVHVFRACALETFAAELFMILQEYLDAKDGVVVRFSKNAGDFSTIRANSVKASTNDDRSASTLPSASELGSVVLYSQQPGKILPGRPLNGKLERKARQFQASNASLTIFITKKAIPAPPAKVPVKAGKLSTTGSGKTKDAHSKDAKRSGPTTFFKGRKFFRYGKQKKQDEEDEKAQQQEQLKKAAPGLQALSLSRAQQLRQETVSLHVFTRALKYQGREDIVIFTVENQAIKAASSVEKLTRQVKKQADRLALNMVSNTPRGDEEINAKRFCTGKSTSLSDGRGGGGFLLLSMLKVAQEKFQQIEGAFGGAMRHFLTGAQATARNARSNATETLSALFGDGDGKSGETSVAKSPTSALLRVSLVACGAERDTILSLSSTDVLKEYLRMQAGRKLLLLDPTDRRVWAALGRARTLLRSFEDAIQMLGVRSEDGSQPTSGKQEASLALHTLLDLVLAQSAVVRYLKYLESELSRERQLLYDAPVTILQCFVRQSLARTELQKRRQEFKAALAIQCAFRQHLARRRLLFMRWTRAAIKVQRAYRRKRQRAKGTRPQRFTAQLLSASRNSGAMGKSPSVVVNETLDGAWRTDMAAFGSIQDYLASKVGREQIKKEEELMWRHRKQLQKERSRLPRDEALREDVGDLFELLDDAGSGELSRDRTAALITRLHVPLNQEEVADVVAMMDSDGSGGISMDEFMRWFGHEFSLLQKRAPRVCGVITRRDWQWVIQQSARSAILKRWRAMRAGAIASEAIESTHVDGTNVDDGALLEENSDDEEQDLEINV